MAALLQLAPVRGTSIAAMARPHQVVAALLRQTAQQRMALGCRWAPHAERRLAFRSHMALRRIPIPPH